jgi:multidrug resistance efflux pump
MEASGHNTTDARLSVEEAKRSLSNAMRQIEDIDARILQSITSEDYTNSWYTIRESFTEIKAQLAHTKELLMEAIVAMRMSVAAGAGGTQQQATTTQAANISNN